MNDAYLTGTLAGAGSFQCRKCGYGVALDSFEQVPDCPHCGESTFERSSLFGMAPPLERLDAPSDPDSEWVESVRADLPEPGHYLACRDDDRVTVARIDHEWTKIGRSLTADIRFDDPTVSRRHALIMRQGDSVSVLDDRSLNGVFLNGERVDANELSDGDQLVIGRYTLHFLDTSTTKASSPNDANAALA